MSAATADRLLRAHRERSLGSPSTTRAGTWLKQRIPLRTFEQWNETRPGFLEADLVAHCGKEAQGSFLYTLALTDIATGWTECLPLRSKHAEAILSALHQARSLFPFPILGLDADNGGEFINEHLLTYCQEEEITFARGREGLKNDQCFIEQKNGAVVRQVVGHQRFEGEAVSRQLGEVYQALRLYVNCFQPSMKLQAKQPDGKKVRRIYDAAKTPFQRLLLSQVLSASRENEVMHMAQMLDPLRLFEHLQDLQHALFEQVEALAERTSGEACLSFCREQCIADPHVASTQNMEHAWQQKSIHSGVPAPVSPCKPEQEAGSHTPSSGSIACSSAAPPCQHTLEERLVHAFPAREEETEPRPPAPLGVASRSTPCTGSGQHQAKSSRVSRKSSRHKPSDLTIEQAREDFLADRRSKHRRSKTLEWHEMALGSLQQYLRTQHHCVVLCQITGAQVSGWLTFLQEQPGATGSLRSPSTVQSYMRSARAFCQWMVQKKYMQATPFASLPFPEVEIRWRPPLSSEEWDCLLLACQPPKETKGRAEQAAHNRALLWVLFDTGMRASEVCALRLGDVDHEQSILTIRGKGSKDRQFTLGQEALRHLLAYLETFRLQGAAVCGGQRDASSASLFLSGRGRPLNKSGLSLLFGRLRKRAGITRKGVTASLLRESFALCYLRAGGDVCTLLELLGQQNCVSLTSLLYRSNETRENEKRRECPEDHL